MSEGPRHGCDHVEGCITCGDEAAAMRIERIDGERELALCVTEDGARRSVEIALVQPVSEGDTVLVHAGAAIGRVAEEVSA
ncbi:MAG TPA: HypC/HybG/HupF family hydrogenase formation chaperone [Solirubrobacterales bacterium]|nr:HypC/HybG/HupF family hydrogenase formation chaperone [Solirubrobacterales bacterium]